MTGCADVGGQANPWISGRVPETVGQRCLRSMTYEQIGEVLDLPVTTVETRLARGRKMLREELEERAVEGHRRPIQRPRTSHFGGGA